MKREWTKASDSSHQSVIMQIIKILTGLGNSYQKKKKNQQDLVRTTKLNNLLKATYLISSKDVPRIKFPDFQPIPLILSTISYCLMNSNKDFKLGIENCLLILMTFPQNLPLIF